jgi:hypothetical protein
VRKGVTSTSSRGTPLAYGDKVYRWGLAKER